MPHADETFYKMKCRWAEDPKVASLARFGAVDACLGRDLFGQMIDYARRELTDGLVPAEVIGSLAYPLPPEHAMQIAMQLADDGPYGSLCQWHAPSNGGGNAPGNALSIVAYTKWNDTREEVQARKAQGIKAAEARWRRSHAGSTAGSNAAGMRPASLSDADAIHRARGQVHTEQEQEQEIKPSAPAQERPREDSPGPGDGSTEDLDRLIQALMFSKTGQSVSADQAAAIREQILGARRIANPAGYIRKALATRQEARVLLPHKDPGLPPSVPPRRPAPDGIAKEGAAGARELLAGRERPAGEPGTPRSGPVGEALARAQLAEARQRRGDELPPEAPPEEPEIPF